MKPQYNPTLSTLENIRIAYEKGKKDERKKMLIRITNAFDLWFQSDKKDPDDFKVFLDTLNKSFQHQRRKQ